MRSPAASHTLLCWLQTGFCANSNCTAIFVGSTLVAGTIISILTCGVCVYRYFMSL